GGRRRGPDGNLGLAGEGQTGGARDEELPLGRRRERASEGGPRLGELFEVVENQERRLLGERLDERLLDRAAADAQAQRIRDRRRDQAAVRELREIDEDGPMLPCAGTGDLDREPRLADPA